LFLTLNFTEIIKLFFVIPVLTALLLPYYIVIKEAGVDAKILLKKILGKQDVGLWTVLIWLRVLA
jgi:hypothetical protein